MAALQEFLGDLSLKTSDEIADVDTALEQLLNKVQQIWSNNDNHQDVVTQAVSLFNQSIDIVDKITFTNSKDLQTLVTLLERIEAAFRKIIYMDDELILLRKIFFALFDLLSKPQFCAYLKDDQHTKTSHKEAYRYIIAVLINLLRLRLADTPMVVADSTIRRYTDILSAMYKRVQININPNTYDKHTVDKIVSFLFKAILECLTLIDINSKGTTLSFIGIIHNISRHDNGAAEINSLDGLAILKNFQNNNSHTLNDTNNLLISMAIALLSTPKQIRSDNKRMNRILNRLLQITMEASETENHRNRVGFHISEPLGVLAKLLVDDHSLEYVLSHAETDPQLDVTSTIDLFVKLFIEFRDHYKTKLQQNEEFFKTVKSLAMDSSETVTVDDYVPRSMESMRKAANGILYNLSETLNDKKVDITNKQSVFNTGSEKPMIMISYAHANDQFCDKILAELARKENLFSIWIDRDHLSSNEDLWEKIAHGIKQSYVVLCLLSQDYFNSKSCRKEASFAVKRKKEIIPVYIGEPGDCDWLDIHIAELKYVRFKSNTKNLDDEKVQELLKTIEATIKIVRMQAIPEPTEQHSIPTRIRKEIETVQSTTFNVNKPLEQWTIDDIHSWFSSYKVPDNLVKLFDFQSVHEMHEYAVKLETDPKKKFIKYEKR
ncbi:unnamed protein product [Rotaria socialis]|uniref:TIR domain-containing protein n=1 Tax=Rotaria socialis TaxID=392032 RepID=A0A817UR44_9BILA|nr:unnamed protein product [Rotaria socialis]